jgi:hypothetical protein
VKETIDRIQDWYKLNCDGDWEHSYGYSIATLDNPGWTIRIDLSETCLEQLDFKKEFQNQLNEYDWFQFKTEKEVLIIACGPENLRQVFEIFLDEILPNNADRDYEYEVYLPLNGHSTEIWTCAKATFINESTLKLTDIPKVEYENIKVRDMNKIAFNQTDLDKMTLSFKVGDQIKVTLEDTDFGLILTSKK